MHRLFVALRPPAAVRAACLAAMEDGPPGWAWQDEEQLHVTLRFIGAVERPLAEDVASALASIRAPAMELALAGAGWFDQGSRGALFARVGPVAPLAALHAKVDRMLVTLGLQPERRAYLPHITLARRRRDAADPAHWLESNAGLECAGGLIDRLILFESHLGRHGPSYEAVATYPLGGA
ncbi:MAG: RNA 2',3'-cyclic phosphodiesterase [Sphingomicrobium sp.]